MKRLLFVSHLSLICFLQTFEEGSDFPHAESANAEILTEGTLEEEHWHASEQDRDDVRYQEGAFRNDTTFSKQNSDIYI